MSSCKQHGPPDQARMTRVDRVERHCHTGFFLHAWSWSFPPLVQTFPLWNVMRRHHEDITKVDFMLTVPSQIIRSSRGGCAIEGLHFYKRRIEVRSASPFCS